MAGNMESLLMGDDSSSGESDSEGVVAVGNGTPSAVGNGGAATAVPKAVPAPMRAPAAASTPSAAVSAVPAPIPAVPAATQTSARATSITNGSSAPAPKMSKAEMMTMKLKNLYSSNKQTKPIGTTAPVVQQQSHPSHTLQSQPNPRVASQGISVPAPVVNVAPSVNVSNRAPISHIQRSAPIAVPQRSPVPQRSAPMTVPQRSAPMAVPQRSAPMAVPHRTHAVQSQTRINTVTQQQQQQQLVQRSHPSLQPTQRSAMIQQQQQPQTVSAPASAPMMLPQTMHSSHTRAMQPSQSSQQPRTATTARSSQPVDPFAPTPLHLIQKKASDRADRDRELRRQKDRFLMFTRVLLKYLEQKDINMHHRVKAIIKDCAERNRRQERGYESVTASMRLRLKKEVGDAYWQRAESYLQHFLSRKAMADRGKNNDKVANPASKMQQPGQTRVPVAASQVPRVTKSTTRIMQHPAVPQQPAPKRIIPVKRPTSTIARQKPAQSWSQPANVISSPTSHTTLPTAVEAPREYSELMEMVDHAVNYDWTTAALLLGNRSHLQLNEEQRNLLFSDAPPFVPPAKLRKSSLSSSGNGWAKHNVVTARTAWARIRLPEHQQSEKIKQQKQEPQKNDASECPKKRLPPITSITSADTCITTKYKWVNEENTEEDTVLALLSEATQIYLKTVLEKAVHCARQRQKLDPIRFWHQQFLPSSINNSSSRENNKPPHLSLRLGCDIPRQVARSMGNASLICNRMEEAIERQSNNLSSKDRKIDAETLLKTPSMALLSTIPLLKNGAQNADQEAKRSFEIYGGKNSSEPPFGRVPKKARLQSIDLEMGMHFVVSVGGRRRAGPVSASFLY